MDIDWFMDWPADALHEVAVKELANMEGPSLSVRAGLCQVGKLATST